MRLPKYIIAVIVIITLLVVLSPFALPAEPIELQEVETALSETGNTVKVWIIPVAKNWAVVKCSEDGCGRDYYIERVDMYIVFKHVHMKVGLTLSRTSKDMVVTNKWKETDDPELKAFIKELMYVITGQKQMTAGGYYEYR